MRAPLLVLLVATLGHAQSVPPRKNIPAIAKAANGAVVSIIMSDKNGQPVAQGSGFIIRKDGRIVTNYHVIAEGTSAVVKLPNGAFFAVDGVLAANKDRDIAIIKAHGENFHTVQIGDSDRVQVGDEVVAIGNPLSLESTVSDGIVSAIRTVQDEGGKFLRITAPISPGSSGGPLFNMAGQVVAITSARIEGGENLNFAIPINDAKALLAADVSKVDDLPNIVVKPSSIGYLSGTLICFDGVVNGEDETGKTQFTYMGGDSKCSWFVIELPLSSADADLLEGRSPEDEKIIVHLRNQSMSALNLSVGREMNQMSEKAGDDESTMLGAIWSIFEQNRATLCSRHPRMFVFDLNLDGTTTNPQLCSTRKQNR